MEINSIQNAFVNALLADATYVDGLAPGGSALSGTALAEKLSSRLTPDLAKYLADHFEVITQKLTQDQTESGFDATVWRSKDDGQVYVSTRGTEGKGDLIADADLTTSGLAGWQTLDMVNWWLKSRAPVGTLAAQIKFETVTTPDGTVITTSYMTAATPVPGDGKLSNVTSVVVNGHSLGGHLSTAFTRLFSDSLPILHTYTYNSATFNPLSPRRFADFALAMGLGGAGATAYPTNGAQTNFHAIHGPDLTTQNFTLGQIGLRMGLFNEETPVATLDNYSTLSNHFMYKMTDALALGNALVNLGAGVYAGMAMYNDSSYTTGKSAVLKFASNLTNAITIRNYNEDSAKDSQGLKAILGGSVGLTVKYAGGGEKYRTISHEKGCALAVRARIQQHHSL